MTLSANMRRLRIADGDSLETVARATGLPLPLLQAIENGRDDVPPKTLRALARHFRIREGELLD